MYCGCEAYIAVEVDECDFGGALDRVVRYTGNYVTKLLKSKDPTTRVFYNSIIVVVNKLTKYSHFILFKEIFNAEQLGHLFINQIVQYQSTPQNIISDRNNFFTSAYWTMLMKKIDMKLKLSTAYHPQTDNQTEQNNQTLKQYLQHFITMQQNN